MVHIQLKDVKQFGIAQAQLNMILNDVKSLFKVLKIPI